MKKLLASALTISACLIGLAGCNRTTTEGPGGTKMSVTVADSQTITRGDTDSVKVSINRDNFRDAVKVHFENLPKGVHVQDNDMSIPTGQGSGTFTLKADSDAQVVENQRVNVRVTGPNGIETSNSFKLTVREKS